VKENEIKFYKNFVSDVIAVINKKNLFVKIIILSL